jgi:magnesium transporter
MLTNIRKRFHFKKHPSSNTHISTIELKEVKKDIIVTFIVYDKENCDTLQFNSIEDLKKHLEIDKTKNIWIDFQGFLDKEQIRNAGLLLSIHPLILEDILNIHHRPKIEIYSDYIFIVAKSFYVTENNQLTSEQVCTVLKENMVITFHGHNNPNFSHIRIRVEDKLAKLREYNADFIVYALLDSFVDSFSLYMNKISESINMVEDLAIVEPTKVNMKDIYRRRKELIFIKKYLLPTREIINFIIKNEPKPFNTHTLLYFRDIMDHTYELMDLSEQYNDMIANLLTLYMTGITARTNEIIRILTVFATIFIPLTFITGIYGMNFKYMPELSYKWAYPILLIIMFLVSVLLLVFFKKKKWL